MAKRSKSKKRKGKAMTAKASKAKNKAKKGKAKKNQIPLDILEKRQKRLTGIVKSRGGKVAA